MKNYILISLLAISLFSCKKEVLNELSGLEKPINETTWISGKWKRQARTDTLYRSNGTIEKVIAIQGYDMGNTFNFATATKASRSENYQDSATYSLPNMTLTKDGKVWKIIKINSTRFNLWRHDNVALSGSLDEYEKVN